MKRILFIILISFSIQKYISQNAVEKNITVNKLKEGTYLVDYNNDYFLDDFINASLSNILSVVIYAIKKFGYEDLVLNESRFGCSAFDAYNKKGNHLVGRNFDFYGTSNLILWTHPKNDYASISTVDGLLLGLGKEVPEDDNKLLLAPIACMDGMNEMGLSISVLQVVEGNRTSQEDKEKKDVITTIMMRGVLDKCSTVKEAVDFFNSYNMHDALDINFHFFISDSFNNSVVIEYIDSEIKLTYPEDMRKGSKNLYVTNFYISNETNRTGFGIDRLLKIEKKLNETKGILNWDQAMDLVESVTQINTLWSIVYNLGEKTAIHSFRREFNSLVKFDLYKPLAFEYVKKEKKNNKKLYIILFSTIGSVILVVIIIIVIVCVRKKNKTPEEKDITEGLERFNISQ